jgi:hypothetical protein
MLSGEIVVGRGGGITGPDFFVEGIEELDVVTAVVLGGEDHHARLERLECSTESPHRPPPTTTHHIPTHTV